MTKIDMRALSVADYPAFARYAADWETDVSPFTIDETDAYKNITAENFPDWLAELEREKTTPANPNYSTANKYFAFINGEIAGVISCRWQIEKGILLEWGGHIGYGVAPSFRGQGIAEQMLKQVLPEYRKRGIMKVMISAEADNIASRKTIEQAGGILENTVEVGGKAHCRYWIDLKKE